MVPLDPVTVAMVRRHERVVGCPWVFTHDGVLPWRPGYVTLALMRASRSVGLDATPHDLRHFAVSQWLASGVSPSTVAGLVGHSSVATTLSTYAHLIRASGRDAVLNHAAVLDA